MLRRAGHGVTALRPVNRNDFNRWAWRPALRSAGVPFGRASGMHALRHFYASVLLDAGESVKALSEYLGHHDPGFTLRTYTHLMPSSEKRTCEAVNRARRGLLPSPRRGQEQTLPSFGTVPSRKKESTVASTQSLPLP
ncbi:tyrosine-type recombinase/integrase [Streptomyces sp. SID8111]|nr:tyrosine-type recombinase/integrase [Streptomyces sp. SID8111]